MSGGTLDGAARDQPTLPGGWTWVPLGELAAGEARAITDGPFGSNLKSEHYTQTGPRVIRLQNVGDGEFIDARAHISAERFEMLRAHEARPGDVVVASLGDALPRACVVPTGIGPAIVKADCPRIRPGSAVEARYLMHALNSPAVREQGQQAIHGLGRPRLKLAELKKLLIPIAPLDEQRAVVARVDAALERVDLALKRFEAATAQLSNYRLAVLRDLLDGRWPSVELRETLVSLRNGIFVSRPAAAGPGIPIFRISAVRPLALNRDDVRYAPLDLPDHERFLVEPGDLLFTRYSGNAEFVGACALVPDDVPPTLHPDKLVRGVVNREVAEPAFLEIACSAGSTWDEIRASRKTSAGQVGIAGKQLGAVRVPLPSIEEQRKIVKDARAQLDAADAVARRLRRAADRAAHLRTAVLAAAFAPASMNNTPHAVLVEA